jgi:hypothetical protein
LCVGIEIQIIFLCVGGFLIIYFLRLPVRSKRCRLLSTESQKLFVQSTKVSSLQGANRVAGNEEGIKEVLKRRD